MVFQLADPTSDNLDPHLALGCGFRALVLLLLGALGRSRPVNLDTTRQKREAAILRRDPIRKLAFRRHLARLLGSVSPSGLARERRETGSCRAKMTRVCVFVGVQPARTSKRRHTIRSRSVDRNGSV